MAGTITNHGGAGGVDWYSFTLGQASAVELETLDRAGGQHLNSVVSLFDSEALDPFYNLSLTAPPFDPQQHRLLAQLTMAPDGTPVALERQLAAGTYFVAVSGQGNEFFNPFLANSGYAGDAGDYQLLVTATPLSFGASDGPTILAADPGFSSGSSSIPVLHSSPLAIYIDFSSSIDPTTVSVLQPGSDPSNPPPTVQLVYNPTGQFGNGNDSQVVFTGFHYAADAMELQLQPVAPLKPGFYSLQLAGNPGPNFNPVLTDASDFFNLGRSQAHPAGQDFITTFQIDGSEGTPGTATADDTAATAHQLGDITANGLVQAGGAIGDDPAYDPFLLPVGLPPSNPFLTNAASDVDLYHFHISGTGRYDLAAEVFAGRIGSTLDAAVSLFRFDASNPTNPWQLIASNNNSGDSVLSSSGQARPLFTDPVLDVGLHAGDYYIAVSSWGNMPDSNGNAPGANGVFDPNVSHSGASGGSTGAYVLNLLVQPAAPAPQVLSASIAAGTTLTSPPTQLTVTFDSHVNVNALANAAFNATSESTVAGVFFVGPAGKRYFPRLQSYDDTTHQARFLMLDRLPNGAEQLHLSGANGLTGYGGVGVAGNDSSGDYVVSFTVDDPTAPADPLNRTEQPSSTGLGRAQDLGLLFPHEVQNRITIAGTLTASVPGAAADSDTYTIRLLESQEYHFALTGPPAFPGGPATLPGNVQMTIMDSSGNPVTPLPQNDPSALFADLEPGTYSIQITWSSADTSTSTPYELHITLLNVPENPPPLAIGSTPVLQIRAVPSSPPPMPPSNPSQPPTVVVTVPQPSVAPVSNPGPITLPASDPLPSSLNPGPTLVVRADLVGGVTRGSDGAQLALAPVQVHGLDNPPTALTSNATVSGTALTSVLLVSTQGSGADADEGPLPPADAVWSSWRDWIDNWLEYSPHMESPSTLLQQIGHEEEGLIEQGALAVPPPVSLPSDSLNDSRVVPEDEVFPASFLLQPEHAGAMTTFDGSPGGNANGVAALWAAALAVLSVKKKTHEDRTPEAQAKECNWCSTT